MALNFSWQGWLSMSMVAILFAALFLLALLWLWAHTRDAWRRISPRDLTPGRFVATRRDRR